MEERALDLLVVGDVNADVLVVGPDVVPEFGQVEKLVSHARIAVGGSSAIAACAAARLALRTAFVGAVGDDELGRLMREAMEARGVDMRACTVDPGRPTGVSVMLVDASGARGRAILTAPGAMATLRAEAVDAALLRAARHVHCGAFFLQPSLQEGLPGLLASARRTGATCSVDPNWDPSGRWDGGIHEVLGHCDVFLPNEAELGHLTGADDVDASLDVLARPDLTIAVKRGAAGADWCRGTTRLRLPAPDVDVVDTTGAGDAFDAGLLCALLRGDGPERQLALAVACGALSTRELGGVDAQPALAEALELAAASPLAGSRA